MLALELLTRNAVRRFGWCALVLCLTAASLLAAAPAAGVAGYGDVAADRYFAEPVQWSVDNDITGIEGNCFLPDAPVSRGETALYIWNMEGQPAAKATHSFTDVTTDAQNPAISWMAETGVTTGTSDTTFSPQDTLERAQIAAFLHRLADKPAAPAHPFIDVVADWQQAPVSWMASTGITTGTSPTMFSPDNTLTRAQLVTFLYRYQGEPNLTVDPSTPLCDPAHPGDSEDPGDSEAIPGADPHAACRPQGTAALTAGFPLPPFAAPSSGHVDVTVLFMDFPDAQMTNTTYSEIQYGLPYMEQYLETASYGRLDLDIDVVHSWWRSSVSFKTYVADDAAGATGLHPAAGAESVRLADDTYDFSDTEIVITVFPSAHFGRGLALGTAHADGTTLSTFRINTHPNTGSGAPSNWGLIAAHELAHNFGLLDHYPYDYSVHALPELPTGMTWTFVEFGLLGLRARYPSSQNLWFAAPVEMLSWTRWQLGWLDTSQVRCVDRAVSALSLSPVAQPGTGIAMVAVPLNEHELIVIESRRKLGYDATVPPTSPSGSQPRHGLLEDGVLVYTVDARVETGQLPLKVAGDDGTSQVNDFPVLTLGESVNVRGYTITVIADDGDTHTVRITRTG